LQDKARLQLLADWNLASQFVEEVFEKDGMTLRLPIQNSIGECGNADGLQLRTAADPQSQPSDQLRDQTKHF
jgi:hypothetical protein